MIEICGHVLLTFFSNYVLGVGKRHEVGVESVESLYLLGLVEVERAKGLLLPALHLLDDLDVAVACLSDLRVVPHQIACSYLVPAEEQCSLDGLAILNEGIYILGQRCSTDNPQLASTVIVVFHVLLEAVHLPLPCHLEFRPKLVQIDLILLPSDSQIQPDVLGIVLVLAGLR